MEGFEVELTIGGQQWRQVHTLEDAGPDDPVFTLNRATGEIVFGDDRRGRTPPAGSDASAVYRYGGGAAGNVIRFSWTVAPAQAQGLTIYASTKGVQANLYHMREHSWRWRLAKWFCNLLLKSVPGK
jgi:hypothetical protein